MTIGIRIALLCSAATACLLTSIIRADSPRFEVPAGSHPHDVAPTPAGGPVYFTAQRSGNLGILDPATGHVDLVALGPGSAPHGVIVGPDGAAWVTDGGRNAIVRVDPSSRQVRRWPLPADVVISTDSLPISIALRSSGNGTNSKFPLPSTNVTLAPSSTRRRGRGPNR